MQVRHPIFDEQDYLDDAKETVRSICPIRSEMRTSCQWWASCDNDLQLRHPYKTYLIMAVLWTKRTCLCHLFINKCLHNACQVFTNFTTREINPKITLSWALKQFVTRVHALLSMYCYMWYTVACPSYAQQTDYTSMYPQFATNWCMVAVNLLSRWRTKLLTNWHLRSRRWLVDKNGNSISIADIIPLTIESWYDRWPNRTWSIWLRFRFFASGHQDCT